MSDVTSRTLDLPPIGGVDRHIEVLEAGDGPALLFLHNAGGHLSEVGELASRPDLAVNDHCRASCVDWYGNARPLFMRGRIIALLGYELVEGQLEGDRVSELRRVNFAPNSFKSAAAATSSK